MNDPDVKLGWRAVKAIPIDDESDVAYEGRYAIHSLVWTIWRLREQLAGSPPTPSGSIGDDTNE